MYQSDKFTHILTKYLTQVKKLRCSTNVFYPFRMHVYVNCVSIVVAVYKKMHVYGQKLAE
jgi:hypothetical protein